MKRYIIMLMAMLFSFSGCEDENTDRKFIAFDDQVVYDYLAENPAFSEWCKLIDKAGLKATFRLSTTPMTCFAVRNEPLLNYIKSKYGYSSVDEMNSADAAVLVKYHTLPNTTLYLSSFRNGKLADSTASGDYLTCLFVSGDGGAVYLNRNSKVISYDKVVVNGIIHELDQVIDPVVNTFMGYIQQHEARFSMMKAMIEACPDSTQALFSQLENNEVVGLKSRRTLLIVPDEVYQQKLGVYNLEELKIKLHLDDAALEQYVRYHLLTREYDSKNIIERLEHKEITKPGDGTNAKTYKLVDGAGITLATMAANKLVVAKPGELNVIFNEAAEGGVRFNGDQYNIPVKNGVLHELDGVLQTVEPSSMLAFFEPTDYINFGGISTYRAESVNKTQTLLKAADYTPYLKWEATPAEKGDAAGYIVFTTGAYNFKGNGFLFGDCLYLSLGPVGYIEFVTPPIPKGNYTVSPFYKTIKNGGGKYKLSIDGQNVGGEFSAYTPGFDNFWITSLGTVSFNETKQHTIRIAVGSRAGELHLDMIIFEPVK